MKRVYQALCLWLLLSWFSERCKAEKRTYMTYDMTSICKSHHDKFKINMHHSGTGSTGILQATDYLSETEEHVCKAVIRPPDGYGVVFNIEDVRLRQDANFECRDHIKIYNETYRANTTAPVCSECCKFKRVPQICSGRCGYEEDGVICEEYCGQDNNTVHMGTGRSIAVHYHTRCGTCAAEKEQIGFRIVFTAYKILGPCDWPLSFQCDNGRCIWAGLTCDGHNNCGDMSDESKTSRAQCGGFTSPVKVIIVTSAVLVTVLIGVVLAYLPRLSWMALCQRRKNASFPLGNKRLSSKQMQCVPPRASVKFNFSKAPPIGRLPGITEHDVEVSTSM